MKNKNTIPDDYFDNQDFLVEDLDESLMSGVLGKNPSPEQLLKYYFCTFITNLIDQKNLSLSNVMELTNIDASDISRIKNHHIDRFTIDRLMKIYTMLDTQHGVSTVLNAASKIISSIPA